MPHSLDQLLPSFQSLGVWTYWIIALFALLEAVVPTGLIVPGSLAVLAGGVLVHQGVIDFFDLAWFVAVGTFVGSEISFHTGRLAARGLGHRRGLATSAQAVRARELLARRGGFAILVGRFLGPVSAFVPFAAALAGMDRRRFILWNATSAVVYGLVHPAIGYVASGALGTLGAAAPRLLAFSAGVLGVLALLWFIAGRIRRALPLVFAIVQAGLRHLFYSRPVRRLAARYPRLSALVLARFETAEFFGLTATVLAVLFLYLFGVYLNSVYDFMSAGTGATLDDRLANLLYVLRDPRLVAAFGWITQFGGWRVVAVLLLGASAALLSLRRFELLTGLWITVIGNQITVTLLKSFFGRPRSLLGYFAETSGSFPSGHAAASVAIWGMLFYLAWRTRLLSSSVAAVAAVTVAFLIGLSRVYLIEHYLSDVLNGYLVGALWLILGVAFCAWRQDRAGAPPIASRTRAKTAAATVGLALVCAVAVASIVSRPLNLPVTPLRATIADAQALFASGTLPRMTQTMLGADRQQINVLVQATGRDALAEAMAAAGWQAAPTPGPTRLVRGAMAYWRGSAAPVPLVFPTYWDGRPNDLGYSMPNEAGRMHARFWRSGYRSPDGRVVFVGTIAVEDPLYWMNDDTAAEQATIPRPVLGASVAAIAGAGPTVVALP